MKYGIHVCAIEPGFYYYHSRPSQVDRCKQELVKTEEQSETVLFSPGERTNNAEKCVLQSHQTVLKTNSFY
jgi:hypothetical protein